MQDMIIPIPDAEISPFAEHDVWNPASASMRDAYRRRTINVLAEEVEQEIARRAQERFDAARPKKWAA